MASDNLPAAVAVREVNGILVVEVTGEVDLATVPLLDKSLGDVLESAPSQVAIDLSGVSYLGSEGLRWLAAAAAQAERSGATFTVREASQAARLVIDIAGIGPALAL